MLTLVSLVVFIFFSCMYDSVSLLRNPSCMGGDQQFRENKFFHLFGIQNCKSLCVQLNMEAYFLSVETLHDSVSS